jgi:hypothetical protein
MYETQKKEKETEHNFQWLNAHSSFFCSVFILFLMTLSGMFAWKLKGELIGALNFYNWIDTDERLFFCAGGTDLALR